MNYFKVLGLVVGLAALLKPVYMHIIPWDENKFLAKTYAGQRPPWVLAVVVCGLLLVAFTWYMHFTADIPYSIVITLLFSLSAVKGLVLLLDYERFQQWVAGMLQRNRGRDIVKIDIAVGVFGAVIVILSLVLY